MKKLLFVAALMLAVITGFSQPVFDLGFKAGVHSSKLDLGGSLDLNSESITKMHWGAFARVGLGRVYLQPEVYFSKKGSDISYDDPSDIIDLAGGFDYGNVDVPLLLGYKLVKGKVFDIRAMAGPVFSFITDADYPKELDPYLKDEFFEDHLVGIQYGLGVDVLFLTLDARMEHAGKFYDDPNLINGKGNSFIVTLGFKIL